MRRWNRVNSNRELENSPDGLGFRICLATQDHCVTGFLARAENNKNMIVTSGDPREAVHPKLTSKDPFQSITTTILPAGCAPSNSANASSARPSGKHFKRGRMP